MNISKPLALMVALLCLSLQSQVRAESYATSKTVTKSKTAELKGSKQLINNDNLIPTQNRTQAMAFESTTGHLPDGEDAILAKQKVSVKKHSQTATSKSRKHSVRTKRGLSHAAIRRGVLEAARGR